MSLDRTLNRPCPGAYRHMTIGHPAPARRGLDLPSGLAGPEATGIIHELLAAAARSERIIAEQRARIDRLEALSVTDDLTGLLNRRGFRRALDRTLDQAKRYCEHGLLCLLDLDGFKCINDRFGHAAGDAVLCAVAAHLRRSVRTTDVAARLGGDEFALVLVRADHIAGRRRLLGLQCSLTGLTVPYDGAQLRVGASLGLHPYGPQTRADDLMRRADEAMYREKRRRAHPEA